MAPGVKESGMVAVDVTVGLIFGVSESVKVADGVSENKDE